MFTIARGISFILLALFVAVAGTSAATTSTFQGTVKDGFGKPIKGAEIRIETNDGKAVTKSSTDAKGHYVSAPVSPGSYKVELFIGSGTRVSVIHAQTKPTGPTELSFAFQNARRKVWVGETGTRLGRWVEESDVNAREGASHIYHADGEWLRRMQDRSGSALGR
jgi:hypothetical protein